MERVEQRHFARNLIVVTAIAEFFSSFTLWLVEQPIKYPLFIIETLSIITIYIILSNYNFNFKINSRIKRISLKLFPDITLIYFSAILITYKIFNLEENTFHLIIAFLCTSFLSGYCLLNICKLTEYFSKLEILILSYLTSFIFSGFCTLILLKINENQRFVIIATIFIAIGIFSVIKHAKNKNVIDLKPRSLSKNIDILAIIISITFYSLFFYFIYPNFAVVDNTDISRHYGDSIILSRTPDLYSGFSYILFHAFNSTLNVLSGFQSIMSFQTIVVILNCFFPLAVYALAKRFLEDVDKRIPAIAAIFYTVLSNFAFIVYTKFKILDPSNETHNLALTSEKAYYGTMYFLQPFPWFVPLSVATIIAITILFLLKLYDLPRSRYIPLLAVLIFAMYLTHPPTTIIFIIFLVCYSLISKTKSLRIDDILLSSLIAFVLAIGFVVYTSYFWSLGIRQPGISFQSMLAVVLPTTLIGISLFWRHIFLDKITFSKQFIISKRVYPVLSLVLISLYLIGLSTWFFNEEFTASSSFQAGVVPWFIYPLLLGIGGLLAIISIKYLGDILPNSSVAILLILMLFTFLIGHILSFVNVNIFQTAYFEKRLVPFIFLASCILAPIPIIKFIDNVNMNRKFILVITSVVVSLIIVSGFSSIILLTEFWYQSTQSNTKTENESQAIKYLGNILQHDSRAFTMTLSDQSTSSMTFAIPPYQFGQPKIITYSKYPEAPLFSLTAHNLPHAYVYMDTRDFDISQDKESWFVQHLLPTLPIVFSNNEVTIYNASHISFPLASSDSTMIIPTDHHIDPQDSWFYAYDIISKQYTNYTVMYDRDQNALKSKNIVLSYDPPENNILIRNLDEISHPDNWKIISGNWKFISHILYAIDASNDANMDILIPTSAENMTMNTSFRIKNIDPNVVRYISLIYSWKDSRNYETAEICLLNDKIYTSFLSVRDGQFFRNVAWPGLPTNLTWKSNSLLTMSLSIQGKSKELSLNGTKYLIGEYADKSDYIGLHSQRVTEVEFEHFDVNESSKMTARDPADYIQYAKNGGNLIVYNTNGHGSIFNSLFKNTGKNFEANQLVTPSRNYLLVDSLVEEISPSSEDVIPEDLYTSTQGNSSILSAYQKVGLGKITYLNIHPLISSFQNKKINGAKFQEILGFFSNVTSLKKLGPNPPSLNDFKFIFRSMNGTGNVTVNSTSIIFANDVKLKKITVTERNNEISISNVTKLDISGYHNSRIDDNFISISDGRGLYSNLVLGNSPHLFFSNNVNVTGMTSDNKLFKFENVSSINILNNESVSTYVRQPIVNIHGNSIFVEPRGAQSPSKIGQNANAASIFGNVSFTLAISDSYNLARDVSMGGVINAIPPLSTYNEMSSFNPSSYLGYRLNSIPLFVYGLLIIPFFVTLILIFPRSKVNYYNSSK